MKITTLRWPGAAVLALSGTFDASTRADFRDACERWLDVPEVREIRVDLRDVRALDASVPGILLLARERARAAGKDLRVANARATVEEALALSAFYD